MTTSKHTSARRRTESGIPATFHTLPTIRAMGLAIFDPIWALRRHTSITNELLYVVRGNVNVHVKGAILKAGPGDTVLIPNGTRHLDAFDLAEGFETYMIEFQWQAEPDYHRRVSVRRFHTYCSEHRAEIEPLVDRLRRDHRQHTPESVWLAQIHLLELLGSVYRGVLENRKRPSRSARQALFEKARAWMDTHYHESVTLDTIAQALSISPYYLSHIFSQAGDFTLFAYLTNLRMQKARLLLQQGGHNVSEAARAVGISDPNYFSRVFHRFFGVPPRDIRAEGAIATESR